MTLRYHILVDRPHAGRCSPRPPHGCSCSRASTSYRRERRRRLVRGDRGAARPARRLARRSALARRAGSTARAARRGQRPGRRPCAHGRGPWRCWPPRRARSTSPGPVISGAFDRDPAVGDILGAVVAHTGCAVYGVAIGTLVSARTVARTGVAFAALAAFAIAAVPLFDLSPALSPTAWTADVLVDGNAPSPPPSSRWPSHAARRRRRSPRWALTAAPPELRAVILTRGRMVARRSAGRRALARL